MNNLKRVLSLGMAGAMLSGMAITASAAETKGFVDADKIQHTEAVAVMNALNVIQGRPDGNFDPAGTVTRGEMAKIICVTLNGGEVPTLGVKANPTFTDIKGHWAESFIEYCNNIGVIGGMGDGTFRPDAPVTGTQAAKMWLVALGYDPDVFGFTGMDWDTNTNVNANNAKLYEDIEKIDVNAGMNRDAAAQMAFNALSAHVMIKSYDKVLSNGEITYNYYLAKNTTLLNDTYNAWRVEGVVRGNEVATLGETYANEEDGETLLKITNKDELVDCKIRFSDDDLFTTSTGKDELGKTVALYVRPDKNSTKPLRAEVIGKAYVTGTDVVTKDNGLTKGGLKNLMKDNGLRVESLKKVPVFVNGIITDGEYDVDADYNVNGYATEFIDYNMDRDVDVVLVDKVDFARVNVYNTKGDGSLTLMTEKGEDLFNTKLAADDVVGFKDVAKDDYVMYQQLGTRYYVDKAESVTGILTDYSSQVKDDPAKAALWVDDVKYVNSGVKRGDTKLLNAEGAEGKLADAINYKTLDEEAVFYLDACGYTVAVNGKVEHNYALATYVQLNAYLPDSIKKDDRANVVFEDGKTASPVVDIAKTDANMAGDPMADLADGNAAEDVVLGEYDYVKGALVMDGDMIVVDGGKFDFTSGEILAYVGDGNEVMTNNGKRVYMTDDTVVFFVETEDNAPELTAEVGDVHVYVGKDNVPSVKLDSAKAGFVVKYLVDGRNNIVAMAVVSGEISAVGGDYMYVININSTNSKTKLATVVLEGEVKDIEINKDPDIAIAEGNVYQYIVEENGTYTLTATETLTPEFQIEKINANERTIVVNGVEYQITKDTDLANVADEEALVFENLQVGDIVRVYASNKATRPDAYGVYVTEAYDPANHNIIRTVKLVDLNGKVCTVDAGVTAGEVVEDLIISGGAKAVVEVKTADTWTAIAAGAELDADATYRIVVIAEDNTFGVYTLDVEAVEA